MTNEEKMKSMTTEELAKFWCNHLMCHKCPAMYLCDVAKGKANGLVKWLKKEVEEE